LDGVKNAGKLEKFLFRLSLGWAVVFGYTASKWSPIFFHEFFVIPLICGAFILLPAQLIIKIVIRPDKEERITRIVSKILDSQRLPNGTIQKVNVDEEVIDKLMTFLKVSNLVSKSSIRFTQNLVIKLLLGHEYNRVISRMQQHKLIYSNQGILTTRTVKNYYTVTKDLLNLGVTPAKVYFEDTSDYFAIVLEDAHDAHFANIAKDPESIYDYISTNKLLSFIEKIKIKV
jgi:hypothetical protein